MALLAKTTTLLHKARHMERFYMKSLLAVLVLVLAVQSCIVSQAFSFSNLTDQSALLSFKTAVKYDPNNVLGNWTTRTNFCNWAGVSCSRHRQRVTALQLPSMGLGGTISPHIGNLSFLMKLDLGNNSFHGFLIQNLTRLFRLLDLSLYDNLLKGEIPTSIQQCQKLQEYGSEGRVSTKGDIYSYGIMLLEAFTRKKPTHEMFIEALSLKQWVNASLPDRVMEVVDVGLLRIEDGRDAIANKDYLLAIMETGVECAAELPERRTDIKDVVTKLNKIKLQLLRNGYA